MVSAEKEESGTEHHIRRLIALATVGLASLVPVTLVAGNEPLPRMPATPVAKTIPAGAQPHAPDGRPVPSAPERVMNGMVQGHQENNTFSEVATIIRDALGPEGISETLATELLVRLIKKYAEKVLENLLDDFADSTSDAIERVGREIVQFLEVRHSNLLPPVPGHQIEDADSTFPPGVDETVNSLRDEVIRRWSGTPLDSRTLSAIQSPAPSTVEALITYFRDNPEQAGRAAHFYNYPAGAGQLSQHPLANPGSAELVACYVRYRVAQGALSAFPPFTQLDAMTRITDTPIRSSAVYELPSFSAPEVRDQLQALVAGTPVTWQDVVTFVSPTSLDQFNSPA